MKSTYKKIVVTGSTGFLGHHVMSALQAQLDAEFIGLGSKDYNLLQPAAVKQMIADLKPDCLVHMAAKSGGIITNKKRPADFFYDNLCMNLHVFEEAFRGGVQKLVTFMGGCSYPSDAKSPIGEDQMWNGYPQIESAGYSVAKKMLITQSWAYRQQHGFNSIVLIPGNLYGEWDNFNFEEAHVIPALLRRYLETQEAGVREVTAYGTGRPTRDFVYAGDVGNTVPWFIENYDSSEPVNISAGKRISIKELAETVKKVTGFEGEIVWDTTKPDGQIDKIFDVSKLNGLGLSCDTPLEEGLQKTIEWFKEARKKGIVRL